MSEHDPMQLAASLIELEGGAVEPHALGLSALLPSPLAAAWGLNEEVVLSANADAETGARLTYGSELLEQVLHTATHAIPVAHLHLPSDLPLRPNQIASAAQAWSLRNGLVEVGDVRLSPQVRVWLDALAVFQGDERREQLVSTVVSAHTGTEVAGFRQATMGIEPRAAREACAPEWWIIERALAGCAVAAERAADGFRAAMTRRHDRDRSSIEGYFEDLTRELDKRAKKGRLDPATVADKRAAMLADRETKLDALGARFVLRVEVAPIALRTLQVDGAFVSMKLRRRKATRTLALEYDAITRRLVAPACDVCAGPAARPAACDDALHLVCERCAPRAEGRIACAACAGKHARPAAAVGS